MYNNEGNANCVSFFFYAIDKTLTTFALWN